MAAVVLGIGSLLTGSVQSASIYWKGATDGSFQTLSNWFSNQAATTPAAALPGASDVAVFNADGTISFAFTTFGAATSLQGMIFNASTSGGLTVGSLNDYVLTLGTQGMNVQAGGGSVTVNTAITVGATQTWTSNGGAGTLLKVAGNVVQNGTLTLAGDSAIEISGPISATMARTITVSNTSNSVTMGAINATDQTQTLNVTGSVTATIKGVVTANSLHKDGTGTLILEGANNLSGTLRVLDGKVVVRASNVSNSQLIFGNASGVAGSNGFGTVELDNTLADVSLRISTLYVHPTSDGGVIQSTGGAFAATLALNGNRDFIVNDTSADVDLLVKVGIANGDATARNLNKRSIGTMVMQGVNTYTGITTVNRGKLVLDYSINNSDSRLADAAALSMAGGILELKANGAAASTETAGSLGVANGTSTLRLAATTGNGVTFTLANGITRAASGTTGMGVINFDLGDTTLNHLMVQGTNGNNAQGILGAWATVGGDRWATRSGNEIVALAGTVQNDRSAWTAADHVVVTGPLSGALSTLEVASIIFDGPTTSGLVVDNNYGLLTLSSG
ncbi:MAG TPA: autotransporter-associated beta strand repeat-containing protein, partial [Verrucomicrobium sp.]|nr:autotransporter-associated beta strand repeat-containing protein [Verrucomicrobium sp.]